jgi:RNA polymerase sigma-70 factor, ECF subfamily
MEKKRNIDFDFIVSKSNTEAPKGKTKSLEDVHLVHLLKQANREAFQTIYEKYYSRILYYCLGYLTDKNIAQETTQDTFVKLWEISNLLPDDTMFQPLLYRIARNNCLNYLKHLKVTRKYEKFQSYRQSEIELNIYALTDESAQLIISQELEARILEVINSLPPACKKVFEMSRTEELKYNEIAEKLGIAVKTVENQIQKALKILRRELEDYLSFLIFINFF